MVEKIVRLNRKMTHQKCCHAIFMRTNKTIPNKNFHFRNTAKCLGKGGSFVRIHFVLLAHNKVTLEIFVTS